ncbi:pyridoxal 5'-phosphate synthase [Paenalcaligenes sp. Me131]|uniref:pyridoxine/pyridoxamine 5'-phosphate oxidase n=1 Tax=Paenalcaligenes sp. Me131 TaxID=3392636 RepID=UPI003D2BCF96
MQQVLRGLKSLAGPFQSFVIAAAPEQPLPLFQEWLQAAIDAGIAEAHAMTLSTVDEQGMPDARVLILKNLDEQGWYFATTRRSPKSKQVEATHKAALTFYWQPLGRQVRIRGEVIAASAQVCQSDFQERPVGSRAGALLGRQSDVLLNEQELINGLAQQRQRVEHDPTLANPDWVVYRVEAHEVEFWQGDTERNHVRLRYRRTESTNTGWIKERLWP